MTLLPRYPEVEIALLSAIEAVGGKARPRDLYAAVAASLHLSEEEIQRRLSDGGNAWETHVQFTRLRLVHKGELAREPRGIWEITAQGRQRVASQGRVTIEPPPPPLPLDEGKPHRQVQDHLREIGEMLGYHARVEDRLYDRQYDVTWRRYEYSVPSSFFEVQHGGSLDSARDKLRHAHDNCAARVCLVVTSERDHEKARQGLGPIQLLRAEEIARLHQALKKNSDVLKRLL